MTIEQYVEDIMRNHPEIQRMMDKLVEKRAEEIKATREMYERTKDLHRLPRYAYIKRIECEGDTFEIEIDLYDGICRLCPV